MDELELPAAERRRLWRSVVEAIEEYLENPYRSTVAPPADPSASRRLLQEVDFESPMTAEAALELVLEGLREHQVHNGHPRYFGLFNPATSTMSIAADALVAAFNPQLAAWTHAPFACDVEQLVVRKLAAWFGMSESSCGGSFTTGGAEANHSAVLTALASRYPQFAREGARALPRPPAVYVSSESHHSFVKAARMCGLGTDAVRHVAVDDAFRMDPEALAGRIREDRAAGVEPLLVVATLGTTGGGLLDPVERIADVAAEQRLWLHADAAWGGAAALVPELRTHLRGIERADSITFDAHKWLAVPMGAGMFLTRHPDVLEKAFAVDTGYMPRAQEGTVVVEPHRTSMQWTRRFIGLKLFLTLLVAGFEGYGRTIRRMTKLGDELRSRLGAAGWRVVNQTPLPIVCFQDARHLDGGTAPYLTDVAARVVASGRAWISFTVLGETLPALRACITNFRTRERDLDALVECLEHGRRQTGERKG